MENKMSCFDMKKLTGVDFLNAIETRKLEREAKKLEKERIAREVEKLKLYPYADVIDAAGNEYKLKFRDSSLGEASCAIMIKNKEGEFVQIGGTYEDSFEYFIPEYLPFYVERRIVSFIHRHISGYTFSEEAKVYSEKLRAIGM